MVALHIEVYLNSGNISTYLLLFAFRGGDLTCTTIFSLSLWMLWYLSLFPLVFASGLITVLPLAAYSPFHCIGPMCIVDDCSRELESCAPMQLPCLLQGSVILLLVFFMYHHSFHYCVMCDIGLFVEKLLPCCPGQCCLHSKLSSVLWYSDLKKKGMEK